MADVSSARQKNTASQVAAPPLPPLERNKPQLPPVAIPPAPDNTQNGHLNLNTFSPVNQNGSFEFDRVLKSGEVHIRSRKTRVSCSTLWECWQCAYKTQQWKKYFLILRPNLISMYKSASEEKLLKQISLSELTAVTYLKDPKGKRDHTFGLFSPSKNYHIQGRSDADTREWIELIREEARIDEEDESFMPSSLPGDGLAIEKQDTFRTTGQRIDAPDRVTSSSPEPPPRIGASQARKGSTAEPEASGCEGASYSDFSDTGLAPRRPSHVTNTQLGIRPKIEEQAEEAKGAAPLQPETSFTENQLDGAFADIDQERTIWHGHLLLLKSKGGMRQWKRLWIVLRPKNLAFYKTDEVRPYSVLWMASMMLSL